MGFRRSSTRGGASSTRAPAYTGRCSTCEHSAPRLGSSTDRSPGNRFGCSPCACVPRTARSWSSSQRRSVADAGHELRTPLALLRLEVEHALEEHRPAHELTAALASVGEEVDRLSQLAEDLFLIARLDEHALPLRRETVPVAELLEG